MKSFKSFQGALQEELDKISNLATEEGLSATKFFTKVVTPALFEGAKTGTFSISGLNEERNVVATKREEQRLQNRPELNDRLYHFEKLCSSYYDSVHTTGSNQEKCMYGLRRAVLLWQTNRLSCKNIQELVDELNDMVSEDMLGDSIDFKDFDVAVSGGNSSLGKLNLVRERVLENDN